MNPVIKPPRLREGGCIGIISPASTPNKEFLNTGIRYLEGKGFKVKVFKPGKGYGYMAGTDEQRARIFNRAFADKESDILICSRGGYGAARMVDKIDWDIIKSNPKVLCGFSDITTLHLALNRRSRMATFHGPMITYNFKKKPDALTEKSLWQAVMGTGQLSYPRSRYNWRTLSGGNAEGIILGGNLTLICTLIASDYIPDFKNKILFLEEIDEEPFRVDRLLAHLKHAGILGRIRGLILGRMVNCGIKRRPSFTLDDVFRQYFKNAPYPVIYNFPAGHEGRNLTLPFGVRVSMDTAKGRLEYLETAVK
ncbi:MAG: LD-carboxypeptidase [candidate division Zixibacteria bacterium]|nr:LD-carboxypeptidase [candidate division Zixibacteria bacterium]